MLYEPTYSCRKCDDAAINICLIPTAMATREKRRGFFGRGGGGGGGLSY